MPRKRVPATNAGSARKKSKVEETQTLAADALAAMVAAPAWIHKVLALFDRIPPVEEYLASVFEEDGLAPWIEKFTQFDDPDIASYEQNPSSDELCAIHTWQISYHSISSTSGFTEADHMRSLITLVACKGFKTDPGLGGVEALLVAPIQAGWNFDFERPKIRGHQLHACACAPFKGWKRALASYFLMVAATKCEVVEEMRSESPHVFKSLNTAWVKVAESKNYEEILFQSREASISLRSKGCW